MLDVCYALLSTKFCTAAKCRDVPNSDIQREKRKAASRRPLHVPLVPMCSSDDRLHLPLSAPAAQAQRAETAAEQQEPV
jgi:hypothetical protein